MTEPTSERIEPGAEAAHRDDLARDVARLWARLGPDDVACPYDFADALDRLAAAYVVKAECCGGTGFADYAAVPCPNPECPVRSTEAP